MKDHSSLALKSGIVMLLLLAVFPVSAQTQTAYRRFNEFNMQPEAWRFTGPVESQVDSKGDLYLNLPLMTIPGNGLDFEVNLTYKAGIRYHQIASWIGLGWNLDIGAVTRDIQGGIVRQNTHYGVDYSDDPASYEFLPDRYYASIPGKGSFKMARSNFYDFNHYRETPFLAPYNDNAFYFEEHRSFKIDTTMGGKNYPWPYGNINNHDEIIRFVITTSDGVRYIYGLPSMAAYLPFYVDIIYHYPNVWRLLAIAGPNYTGPIDALLQEPEYISPILGPDNAYRELGRYTDWVKFEYTFDGFDVFKHRHSTRANLVQNTYLKWIITPTHYADFISKGNRKDIDIAWHGKPDPNGSNMSPYFKQLTAIHLYTRSKLLVKKVELSQDYSLCFNSTKGTGRLTLKEILFKSHDNRQMPGYRFQYASGQYNPPFSNSSGDHYYDGFGYYNSYAQPIFGIDDDTLDAQAWSLKKVTFPSGGTESYTYENDYINDDPIDYYLVLENARTSTQRFDFDLQKGRRRQGGIRTSLIVRTDGMGHQDSIRFSYGPGHVPCVPPETLPWENLAGVSIHTNEFKTYQRGELDVIYEWIEKHYSKTASVKNPSSEKTFYYADNQNQSLLYQSSNGINFLFYNDNSSVSIGIHRGAPLKRILRHGNITDSLTYQYRLNSRIAANMFHSVGNQRLMFNLQQIFPVLVEEVLIQKSNHTTAVHKITTQRSYDRNTHQLKTEKVNTGNGYRKRVYTYAYEIKNYGGQSWDPDSIMGMRAENRLMEVAKVENYYKKGNQPQYIQRKAYTTYKLFNQIWHPHRQYRLNLVMPDTNVCEFSNWDHQKGTVGDCWELESEILNYQYGRPTQYKDGNGHTLDIFYGDNHHNLSNASAHQGLHHAYITGIRLNNKLSKEFDYHTRFMEVDTLTGENGRKASFSFDSFGRLAVHKDANHDITSQYEYQFSRSANRPFDPKKPNYVKSRLYQSSGKYTDSYDYYDGLSRKIQSLTRADGYDYYSAADIDMQGRQHKQYKSYRRHQSAGSSPAYDPDYANGSEHLFTEHQYHSLLDERLRKIYYPSRASRDVKAFSYQYLPAHSILPELYSPSDSTTWLHQQVIDEDGNFSHIYRNEYGNTVLFRQEEITGQLTAVKKDSVSAILKGSGETIIDRKILNISERQEVHWESFLYLDRIISIDRRISGKDDQEARFLIIADKDTIVQEVFSYRRHGAGIRRKNGRFSASPGKTYQMLAIANTVDRHGYAESRGKATYRKYKHKTLTQTYFQYDGAGNLIKIYAPNYFSPPVGSKATDWISTYQYNTLGSMVKKYSADAGTLQYTYDLNGNQRFSQDARQKFQSQVIYTAYDFANRPQLTGEASANIDTLNARQAYTWEQNRSNWVSLNVYDTLPDPSIYPFNLFPAADYPAQQNLKGRLAANAYKSVDTWQITLYSYDVKGRVTSKHILTENFKKARLSYVYNIQGHILKTSAQVGSEAFYHFYTYNDLGQLIGVATSTGASQPGLRDAYYSYYPTGTTRQLKLIEYRTGAFRDTLHYQYNARDWLTRINHVENHRKPFSAAFTYAPGGNIRIAEFNNRKIKAGQRYQYTYQYDAISRLKQADYRLHQAAADKAYDITDIGYDANGNLLKLKRYKENGLLIDHLRYQYGNHNNQLSQIIDAVNPTPEDWDAEDESYIYDANGNLTNVSEAGINNKLSISYDQRNLPVLISTHTGSQYRYRYSVSGQRFYKKIGSQPAQYYVLDGERILGVFDQTGNLLHWNIYGNGLIGRVEKDLSGLRKYMYIKDHLGSTRAVIDEKGSIKESFDYYPFGLIMPGRSVVTGIPTREKFTGKERDEETRWDYFGKRYYNPASAKWLTVDPLAERYPSLSPYVYVRNNPVINYDPDGRFIATLSGLVVGTIGGAVNAYINDGNVLAGAVEGGTSGAIAGLVLDAAAATGGASLVIMVAAGSAGGAAGSFAGSVAGQVTENIQRKQSALEAVKNVDYEQARAKAKTGAKLGVIAGGVGAAVGKGVKILSGSKENILNKMSKNITTTAQTLNKMGASQKVINNAVNKITKGMGDVGKNTAKTTLKIETVTTSVTDAALNSTQIQKRKKKKSKER